MPWPRGNRPVPMVACAHAVTVGNDPMNALRYTTERDMRDRRNGHVFFQCVNTFQPPPSITNVTTTFGGVLGAGMPGMGAPSPVWKSNPMRCAVVGAR